MSVEVVVLSLIFKTKRLGYQKRVYIVGEPLPTLWLERE